MASGNGRTPAVTHLKKELKTPNSKLFGAKVGDKCKEVGDKPAGNKHPAWETNEKKWETNKRKWETSQPGTRPQAPSLKEVGDRPGTRLQAPSLGDN